MVRKEILEAVVLSRDTLLDKAKEVRKNDTLVLTLTYHPSIKNFQNVLNEAHTLLTPNNEHRKVFGDKCEPSSGNKSAPCCSSRCQICPVIADFQTKDKSERFDIRKGILTVVPIGLFTRLSVNHVLSSMWEVLLHRSVAVLIIIRAGLEKCQKVIPRNVMSIKNSFIVTLTFRNTMGWRTGRLKSLTELKMF